MAQFSSALVLTDLNDFINPAQACIKPAQVQAVAQTKQAELRLDADGNYFEVSKEGEHTRLEAASISLNDCLACSGCITSAETVLVAMQSEKELYRVLEQNKAAAHLLSPERLKVVVSIAPQSRASLAAKFGLSTHEVRRKLAWFFKTHLGVDHVLDIAFARDLALIASAQEFLRRYRAGQHVQDLPMLASACPGWICYAEKTHPATLPLIDTTKSPQQIMGAIVKDYLAETSNVAPDCIFHVSVMPCYDKKLEASRQDFYNDVYRTRDVDCVLTTGEIERMLKQESLELSQIPGIDPNDLFSKHGRSEGTSSGGYLSFILRTAAHDLFGVTLSPEDVENGTNGVTVVRGRNPDATEVLFTPPGATDPVLRFAYSYGFRNIQNLVRKIKPGAAARHVRPSQTATTAGTNLPYHYIEVMACPSGCINGGGQLRPQSADTDTVTGPLPPSLAKAWVADTDRAYLANPHEPIQLPHNNPALADLCHAWFGGQSLDSDKARRLLHTAYHAVSATEGLVPSSSTGLVAKW